MSSPTGIRSSDLRNHIIRPTLKRIGLWSEAAENLLMGTAAQESKMGHYLTQINGPALGIYQIEPATYRDLFDNYLQYRQEFSRKVGLYNADGEHDLVFNLAYSTIVARVIYYRAPEPLPQADDISGLAAYWKKYYNTPLGRGTEREFRHNYIRYV